MKRSSRHSLEEFRKNIDGEKEIGGETKIYPEEMEFTCMCKDGGYSYRYYPKAKKVSELLVLDLGNWAEEKTCEGVVQEEWDEFVKYARETEESEK